MPPEAVLYNGSHVKGIPYLINRITIKPIGVKRGISMELSPFNKKHNLNTKNKNGCIRHARMACFIVIAGLLISVSLLACTVNMSLEENGPEIELKALGHL